MEKLMLMPHQNKEGFTIDMKDIKISRSFPKHIKLICIHCGLHASQFTSIDCKKFNLNNFKFNEWEVPEETDVDYIYDIVEEPQ